MKSTAQAAAPAIGGAFTRIDGPLKVSGSASYTSDKHFPGMLYAVPVGSTIASGRITRLNTAAAAKMQGVRAVYTRENVGRFFRVGVASHAIMDEARPPLEDD